MGVDQEVGSAGACAQLFFEVAYDRQVQTTTVIQANGTFRVGDLARSQYFIALRRTWWFIGFWVLGLILVAPFVVFIAIGHREGSDAVLQNAIPFALLVSLWVFLVSVLPYRSARRDFAARRHFRDEVSFVFTTEAVSTTGTGLSSSVSWSNVTRFRETNSIFLLYFGPNSASIIPKRFFRSQDEIEKWRELLASSVDPKLIEKPTFIGRWC
jgi:hypothetical protein